MRCQDDLGTYVELPRAPRRIVSLVPSLTETLFALGLDREVVGVTRFCPVPASKVASPSRIGGTKNPDLRAIVALRPDLVIANAEENRREHVEWLRNQRIAVFVTYPRTVPGAVNALATLGGVLAGEAQAAAMVRDVVRAVHTVEDASRTEGKPGPRVFCPVWKTPWITFNADTYAHDVLRLMGCTNVFADAAARYPRTTLADALERRPDVVLLPDEPYAFTAGDAAEIEAMLPWVCPRVFLIGGRDLHWYGVHMVTGLPALAKRLRSARDAGSG